MYHQTESEKADCVNKKIGVFTCIWKIKGSVRCGAVYSEVHLKHFINFSSPSEYILEFVNKVEVVKPLESTK